MKKYLSSLLISLLGLSSSTLAQEAAGTIQGRVVIETENLKLVELPNHRQAVYYTNEQGKVRLMGQVGKIRAGTEFFHWGNGTPEQAESWDKAGRISPELLNRLKVDNNFGALGGGFYASLSPVDSMTYGNVQIILRIPRTMKILLNAPTYGITGEEWVKVIAQLEKVGISALQNSNQPTWFNIIDANALTKEHVAKTQDWKGSFKSSADKSEIITKFPDIYTSPSMKIEINRYLYSWKTLANNDPRLVYTAFKYFTSIKEIEAIDYSLALIHPAYKGLALQELVKTYQSMTSAEKANLLNSQNLRASTLFPEILKLAMRETALEIRGAILQMMLGRKDSESMAYVKAAMQDSNENLRKYGYYALLQRKDQEALELLRQGLNDPNAEVRSVVAAVAAATGTPESMAIARKALNDTSHVVRTGVVNALYYRQDQAALELLKIGIRDSNADVRSATLSVVVYRKGMRSLDIFRVVMNGSDPNMKAQALAMLKGRNDAESLKYLLSALKEKDIGIRAAAIKALGTRKGNFADIFEAALKDPELEIRTAALNALAGKTDRKSLELVTLATKSEDINIRTAAIAALSGRSDKAAARILISAMSDESSDIRQIAIDAAKNLNGQDFTEIVKLAVADSDEWVRYRAVETLRGHQDDVTFEILKTSTTDESTSVRYLAMQRLVEFKTAAAIDHLKELMMNSTNKDTRSYAIFTLQTAGHVSVATVASMAGDSPPAELTNGQKFEEKLGALKTKVQETVSSPRCEAVFSQ